MTHKFAKLCIFKNGPPRFLWNILNETVEQQNSANPACGAQVHRKWTASPFLQKWISSENLQS